MRFAFTQTDGSRPLKGPWIYSSVGKSGADCDVFTQEPLRIWAPRLSKARLRRGFGKGPLVWERGSLGPGPRSATPVGHRRQVWRPRLVVWMRETMSCRSARDMAPRALAVTLGRATRAIYHASRSRAFAVTKTASQRLQHVRCSRPQRRDWSQAIRDRSLGLWAQCCAQSGTGIVPDLPCELEGIRARWSAQRGYPMWDAALRAFTQCPITQTIGWTSAPAALTAAAGAHNYSESDPFCIAQASIREWTAHRGCGSRNGGSSVLATAAANAEPVATPGAGPSRKACEMGRLVHSAALCSKRAPARTLKAARACICALTSKAALSPRAVSANGKTRLSTRLSVLGATCPNGVVSRSARAQSARHPIVLRAILPSSF